MRNSILALMLFSTSALATDLFPAPPTPDAGSCAAEVVAGNFPDRCASCDGIPGCYEDYQPTWKSFGGWKAIHFAAYYGNTIAAQEMTGLHQPYSNTTIFAPGSRWHNVKPLQIAEMRGHTDTANAILQGGAFPTRIRPPQFDDRDLRNPSTFYQKCVKSIVNGEDGTFIHRGEDNNCWHGIYLWTVSHNGWSLLSIAAIYNNMNYLRNVRPFPSQAFRPLNTEGNPGDGYTPMAFAMMKGHDDMADFLYQIGHPPVAGYKPTDKVNSILYRFINEGNPHPHSAFDIGVIAAHAPSAIRNYVHPHTKRKFDGSGDTAGFTPLYLLTNRVHENGDAFERTLNVMLRKPDVKCRHSSETRRVLRNGRLVPVPSSKGNPAIAYTILNVVDRIPPALMSICKSVFPFGGGAVGSADAVAVSIDRAPTSPTDLTMVDEYSSPTGQGMHIAHISFDAFKSRPKYHPLRFTCIGSPQANGIMGWGTEGGGEGGVDVCSLLITTGGDWDDYDDRAQVLCPTTNSPIDILAGQTHSFTPSRILGDKRYVIGCSILSDQPFRVQIGE